jgi:hypothetical protein
MLPYRIQLQLQSLQKLCLSKFYQGAFSHQCVHRGFTWWGMYMQIPIPYCHIAFNCNHLSLMYKIIFWKLHSIHIFYVPQTFRYIFGG